MTVILTKVAVVAQTILILGDSHLYGKFGETLHKRFAELGEYAVHSEAICGATPNTFLDDHNWVNCGYRVRASAPGETDAKLTINRVKSKTEGLATLLHDYDPNIVIVALGTNRGIKNFELACENFLQSLLEKHHDRKIYWIGPPAFKGSDRTMHNIYDIITREKRGIFIDSIPFNQINPLPRSNPHFGPKEASNWADFVFLKIKESIKNSAALPH